MTNGMSKFSSFFPAFCSILDNQSMASYITLRELAILCLFYNCRYLNKLSLGSCGRLQLYQTVTKIVSTNYSFHSQFFDLQLRFIFHLLTSLKKMQIFPAASIGLHHAQYVIVLDLSLMASFITANHQMNRVGGARSIARTM